LAVSREVGMGIVPMHALGRRYRDVLGRMNAGWSEDADEAVLVVASMSMITRAPTWDVPSERRGAEQSRPGRGASRDREVAGAERAAELRAPWPAEDGTLARTSRRRSHAPTPARLRGAGFIRRLFYRLGPGIPPAAPSDNCWQRRRSRLGDGSSCACGRRAGWVEVFVSGKLRRPVRRRPAWQRPPQPGRRPGLRRQARHR
jgi:Cobinamide kinase / cobinamide phosphate guanyltransferase